MSKFCKDCVFSSDGGKYAKCFFNVREVDDDSYHVTGKKVKSKLETWYCSTMRSMNSVEMCKKEGIHFVALNDNTSFEYGVKSYWTFFKKIRVFLTIYLPTILRKKN